MVDSRETSQNDPVLYREVRSFARRRAILPFAFTTVFLVFLMVNLGTSNSGEGMGRNVLVGSSLLVLLQFGAVPFLIWREEDEAMMAVRPTATRDEKGWQQQQQPLRQHQKRRKRPPPPQQQQQQQQQLQRQRQQHQQEEQQRQRRRRRRQPQLEEEKEEEEEEKMVVVVEELEFSMPM